MLCLRFSPLVLVFLGVACERAATPSPAGSEPPRLPATATTAPAPSPHSIFQLKERLTSPDKNVRSALLIDLRKGLPSSEALTALHTLLKDPEPYIRDQAVMALVSWGFVLKPEHRPTSPLTPSDLTRLRGENTDRNCGPKDETLCSSGAGVGYAANKLGVFGDNSDIARLKPHLQNANIYVRFAVANALRNLGAEEVGLQALRAMAQSPLNDEGERHYHRLALFLVKRAENPHEDPLVTWKNVVAEVAQRSVSAEPPQVDEEKTRKDCESRGGRWGGLVSGRGRAPGCHLPTGDEGKPCEDSSQCKSACVADSTGKEKNGRCHGWPDFRGCGVIQVVDGKRQVLCVD